MPLLYRLHLRSRLSVFPMKGVKDFHKVILRSGRQLAKLGQQQQLDGIWFSQRRSAGDSENLFL